MAVLAGYLTNPLVIKGMRLGGALLCVAVCLGLVVRLAVGANEDVEEIRHLSDDDRDDHQGLAARLIFRAIGALILFAATIVACSFILAG